MFLLKMLGDVNRIIKLFTTSKGVFGRVDFREDEKKNVMGEREKM